MKKRVVPGRRFVKVVGLGLESGERVFVGVDVHQRMYPVAIWSDRRGLLTCWVQPARPELLVDKSREVKAQLKSCLAERDTAGWLPRSRLVLAESQAGSQAHKGPKSLSPEDRRDGKTAQCPRWVPPTHKDGGSLSWSHTVTGASSTNSRLILGPQAPRPVLRLTHGLIAGDIGSCGRAAQPLLEHFRFAC
jgi:hypothetical protein